MRLLHLGSGDFYLQEAVNVDSKLEVYPDVVADVRELPFSEGTFDSVCAIHLVEHIPYRYLQVFLTEVFRVLKPEGTLIIETPEIVETFKEFVAGDEETKRSLLSYIFGLDMEGMKHEILYPRVLLEMELKDAGFEGILWEEPRTHQGLPGMRLTARRSRGPRWTVKFWKYLWHTGFLKGINQLEVVELRELMRTPGKAVLYELAAFDPAVLEAYKGAVGISEVHKGLVGLNCTLWRLLKEDLGKGLLVWNRKEAIKRALDMEIQHGVCPPFSTYRVEQFLRSLLVRGIRAWRRGELEESERVFMAVSSVGLYGYGLINLARVMWKKGKFDEARRVLELLTAWDGTAEPVKRIGYMDLEALKRREKVPGPLRYGEGVFRRSDACCA